MHRLAVAAHATLVRGNRADAVELLLSAESELDRHPDPAAVPEATRVLLADCYLRLRMYEAGLPHLTAAGESRRVEAVQLRLLWADELDQVAGGHCLSPAIDRAAVTTAAELRGEALRLLARSADPPGSPEPADHRALGEHCRLATDPATMDENLWDAVDLAELTDRVAVGLLVARSRAALILGRLGPAHDLAVQALAHAERSAAAQVDQVMYRSALFALHRVEVALDLPGARDAAPLVVTTARRLWLERSHALEAARFRRSTLALADRRRRAERLSGTDPVTRLANRASLDRWLAERPTGPAVLLLLDLNDFKTVNDHHGHLVGDRALIAVGQALSRALPGRLVCRYGGDEFAVLSDLDTDTGEELSRTARHALTMISTRKLPSTVRLDCTVSWSRADSGCSTEDLIETADALLLTAKGRRGA